MKLSRSMVALAVTGIFAASCLTACSSDDAGDSDQVSQDCEPRWEFETITSGKLTIAAVQQLPAADVNPNTGELTGLDTVLLEEFAKQACLQTDWQAMSGAAAVAALTEGVADVGAGGFFKSEARGEVMGQTTATWFDAVGILANEAITTPEQFVGKKVGLIGGAFFEGALVELIGQDSVIPYQSIDGAIEDLLAGRIDAVYNSGGVLAYQKQVRGLDQFELTMFEPDPEYPVLTAVGEPNLPFTKTNEALGAALDEFLAEKHADGTVVEALATFGIENAQVPDGEVPDGEVPDGEAP